MNDADDFWVYLVRLSESYNSGGKTGQERAAYALQHFREMPPLAQQEVLNALRNVAVHIPDLYTIAAATDGKGSNREHPAAR